MIYHLLGWWVMVAVALIELSRTLDLYITQEERGL